MSEVGVRFQGLRELDRALGKADRTLRDGLRDRLRDAGQVVAVEARSIVQSKQLVASGDLLRSIRPFAVSGRAGVRASARHRGFPYPQRLEYEDGGRRAFLNPAVDRKETQIMRNMEHLLDQVADDFEASS